MPFREIDVLGIYVAPIAVLMLVAWVLLAVLRRAVDRLVPAFDVWHPALFNAALYLILLSILVLVLAGRSPS